MQTTLLAKTHWNTIEQRVSATIKALRQRTDQSTKGRQIPGEESLLIGDGKQLNLAVLFLDICGFTSWKSASFKNQDDILTIFNLFMTEMVRISSDYGGTVEKNTGDGLMSYFEGDGENKNQSACETALAAALTMFYVSNKLINPVLRNSSFQTIDFRIGIDFGRVTIAKIGSPKLFNSLVAIGISANIANKMLRDAGKNEIIIGNDVYLNIGPTFKQWCTLYKTQTGFVYNFQSGYQSPYPYYKYTGRWTQPL